MANIFYLIINYFSTLITFEIFFWMIIFLLPWIMWKFMKSPKNIPPGPRGVPLLGFLPFLEKKLHIQFNELAKKYGDVFSFFLGGRLFIVLNSYEAIKEAFVKQAETFAGRIGTELLGINDIPTIFDAEGEIWRDYKRFTLSTLRDFGIGKLSLEPRIKEEIHYLLRMIESYQSKPTDIGDLLRMSVSNIICSIKYGKRFDYYDKNFQYLIGVLNEHVSRIKPLGMFVFIPKLLKIPGVSKIIRFKTARETGKLLRDDIRKKIADKAKEHITGNEDDFVSAFLTEAKKRGSLNGKHFTNEHLVHIIISLFIAGTDTTANTLKWGLMYLMKHPQVQTRIQQELDEVIGQERTPSITDRQRMPYTEAALMEIQRCSSLIPLAIPHCTIQETTLNGFYIPKRTIIIPNLWAVHFDPKTFPEPEKFRPERFLDDKGNLLKEEKLIPFSLGKRQCLGESLAKMELFLYFTAILQKFTFQRPEGETISFDYDMGVVIVPKSFRTVAIQRNFKPDLQSTSQ